MPKHQHKRKGVPCATGDPLVQRNGKMFIIAKSIDGNFDIPVPCSMKTMTQEGKLLVSAGKNVSIEVDPITKKVYRVLVAGDLVSDGSAIVIPKPPDLKDASLIQDEGAVTSSRHKAIHYFMVLAQAQIRLHKALRRCVENHEALQLYEKETLHRKAALDSMDPDSHNKQLFNGSSYRQVTPYDVTPYKSWDDRTKKTPLAPGEVRKGKDIPRTDVENIMEQDDVQLEKLYTKLGQAALSDDLQGSEDLMMKFLRVTNEYTETLPPGDKKTKLQAWFLKSFDHSANANRFEDIPVETVESDGTPEPAQSYVARMWKAVFG
jgi:hypothetical protein